MEKSFRTFKDGAFFENIAGHLTDLDKAYNMFAKIAGSMSKFSNEDRKDFQMHQLLESFMHEV